MTLAKWRAGLGLGVGVFLILSGFAHTFLGGPAMGAGMAHAMVPPDLARGLMVGWVFGGVAMLVFGGQVVFTYWRALRGESISVFPVLLVALGYLVFGSWALVFSRFDLFFLVFLIPAVLLGVTLLGAPPLETASPRAGPM